MQQLPNNNLLATRPSGSQQPRWLPSPARDTRLVAPTSFFNSPNFPQTSPTARPATAAPLQRTCPVPCAPGPSACARPCALGPSACTSCPCAPWSSAPRTPQWPCRDLQWWHVSHFRFKQKSEIRNPISCYTPRYFGYQVKHDRDSGRNPWYFCKKSYFYALRNPFIYRIGRVLRCPSLEARAQRLKARSWGYFRRCKTSADPNPLL